MQISCLKTGMTLRMRVQSGRKLEVNKISHFLREVAPHPIISPSRNSILNVHLRVNIRPGYRQDVVDGKTSLGTKCRLAASGPVVYKIPEDMHRNTRSFEKIKYLTFQDAKILCFLFSLLLLLLLIFFFSSWDESGNNSSDRFYIIKEISLPKGNQPNQRLESGANPLTSDSL